MFSKILVPLDGSPLAESVLPHVAIFSAAFGAHVTLLHVVACNNKSQLGTSPVDPLDWRVRKAEAQAYLNTQVERLGEADISADTVLLEGHPAERIIKYVRDSNTDLIIMSSHGKGGVSAWNAGALVQKVLERVHISSLLVRAYQSKVENMLDFHYERVLAPLDGSPRAECAVSPGAHLAEFEEAQLILAHIITKPVVFSHMPPEPEFLDIAQRLMEYNRRQASDYLEQLQGRLVGNIATRIVQGEDVALDLHQLNSDEEVDLVVLSAHGYSGKTQWPYGSVTTNLMTYSSSPILMVQDLSAGQIEPTLAERFAIERVGH